MKSVSLTEDRLIAILKDMNLATKDDVLTSERRMVKKLREVKNDLAARIVSLALTTPTIREFEKLKQEVAN